MPLSFSPTTSPAALRRYHSPEFDIAAITRRPVLFVTNHKFGIVSHATTCIERVIVQKRGERWWQCIGRRWRGRQWSAAKSVDGPATVIVCQ